MGASHGGLEHHRGAGRQPALRAHEFSARSRAAAGQRGREARAVQRRTCCSTSSTSSGPTGSDERDGEGFDAGVPVHARRRAAALTPMAIDYDTVGDVLRQRCRRVCAFVVARWAREKRSAAIRSLQLSREDIDFQRCQAGDLLKTALRRSRAIVSQGEGAPRRHDGFALSSASSAMREELRALRASEPGLLSRRFPRPINPVLRRPPRPEGRVWIEDDEAARRSSIWPTPRTA